MNSRLSTEQQLSSSIKAEALSLGFFACGIARATPVDAETASAFRSWIGNGCHAGMEYMARHTDIRLNPDLLLPGAKSVVCVAMAYAPQRTMPADEYQIAAYAYGKDYHDAVKARLRALAAHMEQAAAMAEPQPGGANGGGVAVTRVCCDTAPVLERYWAMQAGLGWTGRNHQLIIPGAGSMFFLGEVFTTLVLQPDAPIAGHCGSCHACTKACPTHADPTARSTPAGACRTRPLKTGAKYRPVLLPPWATAYTAATGARPHAPTTQGRQRQLPPNCSLTTS